MSTARFPSLAILTAIVATLLGCGGSTNGGQGIDAPSGLGYAASPATYTKGVAVAGDAPHALGGAVTRYAVSPDLPAGLVFDTGTGIVSGTPSVVSPLTAYTVTAANSGGGTTCSLLIAVNDAPPAGLSYPQSQVTYTLGVAIAPAVPVISGGAVIRFTTSPALPPGLVLDARSGVISGTPASLITAAAFHLTATNSGGSSSFDLTITVSDVPPAGLAYSSDAAVYVSGATIAPNRPSASGGPIVSYSIAPALPASLSLDAATGLISGTPGAPSALRTYTVTAVNSGGSATCTLTITVIAPAPTNLVYSDLAPIYTRGTAITPDIPVNAGGAAVSFSVSAPLPAGLSFDLRSGIISGTPSADSPATAYTVTATNSGGSTTCVVTLTVREAAPTALVYATNPTAYTVGTPIQPNLPAHGGGIISSYTVQPDLPAGLSLDPQTGIISGTPSALMPQATYVITGANATGSTTCSFVTQVGSAAIPAPATPDVTADAYVTTGQSGLQASTQDQGTANGITYQWTLTNGTVTSGQGTRAITYTAGAAGPLTIQAKVANLAGSAIGERDVTVVEVPRAEIFAQGQVLAGSGARASVAVQANMSWQWTLSGPSAGTIVSGNTNVALYTAGLTPGAYQLSVVVQSPAGGSASASRNLQVVSDAFQLDARASRERYGHTITELLDGRLLVAGGDDPHVVSAPGADLYDPWSNTWTQTGPMVAMRSFHAATLLADGRVLVSGGADFSGAMLDSAEIYDPAANAWTAARSMNATRQNHAATALADGTVLVTGGFGLDAGGTTGGYLSSAEIYDPASQGWSSVTPMSSARSEHTATLLQNGLVLVASGASGSNLSGWLKTAELYDPSQLTWTSVGSLAKARTDATATLLPSGKVLVAGGFGTAAPLADGEVFDPGSGAWTKTSNLMSAGHANHAAALLPTGQVLVIGGSNDSTGAQVESYDPATNRWTRVKDLLAGRTYATGMVLRTGQVLVTGGRGVSGAIGSPEVYDPASDTWSGGGSWASSRYGHTTTVLNDGSLLVAGGAGDATGHMDSAERFDPVTGSWTSASKLSQGRLYHTASLLADGSVLVAGGLGSSTSYLDSAEIYTPGTNAWTQTGSLTGARYDHTATVLGDGKVLLVGGYAGAATLASAELYDPSSGQWTSAGTLSTPRAGHTATLLPGGKVLVSGGGTGSTWLKTVEVYDPAQNSWTLVAPMISERKNHTATLLPDGTVLAMGGQRDGNGGLGTVELYDPAADGWTALAGMASPRFAHAATLVTGGRVLVTGGRLTSATTDGTAELYDPVQQTTTALPMNEARAYHTATVINAAGTVLVLGGSPGAVPEYWVP